MHLETLVLLRDELMFYPSNIWCFSCVKIFVSPVRFMNRPLYLAEASVLTIDQRAQCTNQNDICNVTVSMTLVVMIYYNVSPKLLLQAVKKYLYMYENKCIKIASM